MIECGPRPGLALGQKQTSVHVRVMSTLPPKADIRWCLRFCLRPCAIVPMESAKCQGYDRRGASGPRTGNGGVYYGEYSGVRGAVLSRSRSSVSSEITNVRTSAS